MTNIIPLRCDFSDPKNVLAAVRDNPLSLRTVVDALGFKWHQSDQAPKGFIPADEEWMDKAKLFIRPAFTPETSDGDFVQGDEIGDPGSSVWLEGHYLDGPGGDIVVFPNESSKNQRIMLFVRHSEGEEISGELSSESEDTKQQHEEEPIRRPSRPMDVVSVEADNEEGEFKGPFLWVRDKSCFLDGNDICTAEPGTNHICRSRTSSGKVQMKLCLRLIPKRP
ncbi:hypothetical protein [Streptomyces sp. SID12488]|uniref:hypothetical protein n=1 Tax=Streptomyces sp. SID12488 TaxID=2706040 RepID=UPI0013DA5B06|nr:hypothetical protein [Streptomyces sp. SID12488]NEA65322.1 hypothetical protein [Streptomyces sp. SID12488]